MQSRAVRSGKILVLVSGFVLLLACVALLLLGGPVRPLSAHPIEPVCADAGSCGTGGGPGSGGVPEECSSGVNAWCAPPGVGCAARENCPLCCCVSCVIEWPAGGNDYWCEVCQVG